MYWNWKIAVWFVTMGVLNCLKLYFSSVERAWLACWIQLYVYCVFNKLTLYWMDSIFAHTWHIEKRLFIKTTWTKPATRESAPISAKIKISISLCGKRLCARNIYIYIYIYILAWELGGTCTSLLLCFSLKRGVRSLPTGSKLTRNTRLKLLGNNSLTLNLLLGVVAVLLVLITVRKIYAVYFLWIYKSVRMETLIAGAA